jgi:hypothetical protein
MKANSQLGRLKARVASKVKENYFRARRIVIPMENEKGGTCSISGRNEVCIQIS